MKQIITQHGWGLNKYFWDDYKVDFLNNNWHWQDNERGYFSTNNYQAKWIKSESKKEIRMTLCHSFGFHLMQKKILKEATHIVLINSFNNFLPLSNKRNFILRSLKRMETKIIKDETKDMLKEFIYRSFMPNHMNNSFPIQGDSHILSIIVGQEEEAIYLQKYLEENGFLAIAIRPPTVPVGQSRIRITIRRNLDLNLLENFILVLKEFK